MNLRNKVALITGGTTGIGHAIAQTLSQAGARVAITGRNQQRLTRGAAALASIPFTRM